MNWISAIGYIFIGFGLLSLLAIVFAPVLLLRIEKLEDAVRGADEKARQARLLQPERRRIPRERLPNKLQNH
jgi:hypothetical protein